MKRELRFLMVFLIILPSLKAQLTNWQWARSAASPNNEKGWDVALDKNSATAYVAGMTEGGLGNVYGTLFGSTLGSRDGFVAKYTSAGNVLWAFHIGSTSSDEIKSIATDPFGNFYILGTFQALMDFDPGAGIVTLLPNLASQDGFLAKYSSDGDLIWATKYGGSSTDDAWKVYADSSNVYICGSYIGSATFYSTNSTTKSTAATQGLTNFFGAKYDSNGIIQWVVSGGSTKNDEALDVVADKNKVYFTGSYERDFTIYNALGVASSSLQILSSDKGDVFVLAYNQDGSFSWATNACSQDIDEGHGITQDNTNIYIAGSYRNNTISFPYPAPIITRTNKGGNDIFVGCISKSTGTWQWVSSQTGSDDSDEEPYEIDTDNNGNIVMTGYFKAKLDYSPFGGSKLLSAGSEDIFLTGLSKNNGNFLWCQQAGSSGSDIPHGISVTDNGEIYMTGDYSGNASFGTSVLNADNGDNIFVAKTGCNSISNNVIPGTQTVCVTANLTISGSIPTGGATGTYTYSWQQSNDGNSWQPASGINNQPSYSTTSLSSSFYLRRLVSAQQVCNNPLPSNTMYLSVDPATPPSDAGPDQSICTPSTTVTGNLPTATSGSWSILQGTAVLTSSFNPTTIISSSGTGSIILRWTLKSGVCPATFDDIVIIRYQPPSAAVACADASLDLPDFQLSAVTPTSGTGHWNVVEGAGVIENPLASTTKISSLAEGKNIIRWTVTGKNCGENNDDVILTVKSLDIPNAFTPNDDSYNDQFVIRGLERYQDVSLTIYNRWGSLVYFNANYKNTWRGTNMNNERLADDTYYYTLEIPGKKNYNGFIIVKQGK